MTDQSQESHDSEYSPPPLPLRGRERGRGLGIRDGWTDRVEKSLFATTVGCLFVCALWLCDMTLLG